MIILSIVSAKVRKLAEREWLEEAGFAGLQKNPSQIEWIYIKLELIDCITESSENEK